MYWFKKIQYVTVNVFFFFFGVLFNWKVTHPPYFYSAEVLFELEFIHVYFFLLVSYTRTQWFWTYDLTLPLTCAREGGTSWVRAHWCIPFLMLLMHKYDINHFFIIQFSIKNYKELNFIAIRYNIYSYFGKKKKNQICSCLCWFYSLSKVPHQYIWSKKQGIRCTIRHKTKLENFNHESRQESVLVPKTFQVNIFMAI